MNSNSNLSAVRRQALESDGPQTLQRTLGTSQLVLLGVGAIIGAGIFVATGTVAANNAGPAIVISLVLAAAACMCAGLCYAEFAAMMPVAGSAYSYVYATFGREAGWMIGWCLMLEYLMSAAIVAVGWSGYFSTLLHSLGFTIPAAIASPPFVISPTGVAATGAVINAPAVLLLAGVTALLIKGVRLSVRMNATLVAIKLSIIALFIVFAAPHIDTSNWQPFVPPNRGQFGELGWSGVLRGAGIIFYAYLGFDMVSAAAREARNPQRSMPYAIVGALALSTLIYIAFTLVLTGLAPYYMLGVPNPVSAALDHAGTHLQALKLIVEIGAVVGLTSVVLVILFGQSRILYALARDGLIPAAFGRISASSGVPLTSVLTCGIVATLAAGLLPIEVLGELISIGTLTAFAFVCAAVLVLRITRPDIERPFRTPFAPLICTAGTVICIYLMSVLPGATWRRFAAWLLLGIAIYVFVGARAARRTGAALADPQ